MQRVPEKIVDIIVINKLVVEYKIKFKKPKDIKAAIINLPKFFQGRENFKNFFMQKKLIEAKIVTAMQQAVANPKDENNKIRGIANARNESVVTITIFLLTFIFPIAYKLESKMLPKQQIIEDIDSIGNSCDATKYSGLEKINISVFENRIKIIAIGKEINKVYLKTSFIKCVCFSFEFRVIESCDIIGSNDWFKVFGITKIGEVKSIAIAKSPVTSGDLSIVNMTY